ncbi:hypothetical protein L9F63_006064, partial [Diploptera punctata]
ANVCRCRGWFAEFMAMMTINLGMNAVHFVSLLFCATNIILAFLTLLERKVLGYVHIRKGPNKVGFIGILQPFRDAIKLLNDNKPILMLSVFLHHMISQVYNKHTEEIIYSKYGMKACLAHYSRTFIFKIQFFASMLCFLEITADSIETLSQQLLKSVTISSKTRSAVTKFSENFLTLCTLLSNALHEREFFVVRATFFTSLTSFRLLMTRFNKWLAQWKNRAPLQYSRLDSIVLQNKNMDFVIRRKTAAAKFETVLRIRSHSTVYEISDVVVEMLLLIDSIEILDFLCYKKSCLICALLSLSVRITPSSEKEVAAYNYLLARLKLEPFFGLNISGVSWFLIGFFCTFSHIIFVSIVLVPLFITYHFFIFAYSLESSQCFYDFLCRYFWLKKSVSRMKILTLIFFRPHSFP